MRPRTSARHSSSSQQQQLETDLAETRIAFGRALRSLGRTEEAREELRRARATFMAMDACTLVAAIDRDLDDLEADEARGAGAPADPPPSATGAA